MTYGSMNLQVFCDGACNMTGKGGYGWFVQSESGNVLHEHSGKVEGDSTNNIAEYEAVITALQWLKGKTAGSIAIFTDSMLVVCQVSGKWRCKKEHLKPYQKKAKKLLSEIGATLAWIPREQNIRADELSRVKQ